MENIFIQRDTYRLYSEHLLQHFSETGATQVCKKREIIELSGNPAEYVYLIREGYIRQSFIDPNGSSMILFILSPGNLFNEVTLLNRDRSCVVSTAHTNVSLQKIRAEEFWSHARFSQEASWHVSRLISYKLRMTMALLYDLSFCRTEERLQNLLLRLCIQIGERDGESIRVPVHITHEELAQMIVASRSTVSHLLKQFSRTGFVTIQSGFLVIHPPLLEKMPQGLSEV